MAGKTKRAERIAAKLAECLRQGDGKEDLAQKARRHFRAKRTAKRKYDEADRIAQELLATVGPRNLSEGLAGPAAFYLGFFCGTFNAYAR